MKREAFGERVLTRVLAVFAGVFFVIIVVLYCRDLWPVHVTVGTLSERNRDFTGKRIVIHNGGTGKQVGRYVFYDTIDPTRHCVVLALAGEVKPDVTTFRGYVVGVMEEGIAGCSHNPPFLLVIDVKPMDP